MTKKQMNVNQPKDVPQSSGRVVVVAVADGECTQLTVADNTARLARLQELETTFERGVRESIEALRDIFAEKLYLEMGYKKQEEYMTHRWAKTRQWAEDELTRLKAIEFLESKGVKDSLQNLSKDAAQVFLRFKDQPAVFYGAYLRVAAADAKPTKPRLEKECAIEKAYLCQAGHIPNLTFEEFKEFEKLEGMPICYTREKFTSLQDLQDYCVAHKEVPSPEVVATVARGTELAKLVEALEPVVKEVVQDKAVKAKEDANKKAHRRGKANRTRKPPKKGREKPSANDKSVIKVGDKIYRVHQMFLLSKLDVTIYGYEVKVVGKKSYITTNNRRIPIMEAVTLDEAKAARAKMIEDWIKGMEKELARQRESLTKEPKIEWHE